MKTIVKAMDLHLNYAGIQEMAIIAIQNIIIGTDARDKQRKMAAIDAGALASIANAIKKFEGTASVFEQGTGTLRLLCNKESGLKSRAIAAGAKKEWLKSTSGSISQRLGFTSRKNK